MLYFLLLFLGFVPFFFPTFDFKLRIIVAEMAGKLVLKANKRVLAEEEKAGNLAKRGSSLPKEKASFSFSMGLYGRLDRGERTWWGGGVGLVCLF